MGFWSFRPYVPVAKRRAQAAREIEKLRKKRPAIAPVLIEGRKIAHSFWGRAWCENLERYSDFESRLPRGRSYVRNGLIVDLQIERGALRALVSGSDLYEVQIDIAVAAPARWRAICKDCAGSIGSLVELLQGKLSKNVMERVCREGDGLFPAPSEIKMSCSCPDWADMCKHVAATLYGVGARLDATPDLLFTLRDVNRAQLIATASADLPTTGEDVASNRLLSDDDIGALFGIAMTPPAAGPRATRKKQAGSGVDFGNQHDRAAGIDTAKRSSPSSKRDKQVSAGRSRAAKKSEAATPVAHSKKKTAANERPNKPAEKDSLGRSTGKAADDRTSAPDTPAGKPLVRSRRGDGTPPGRTRAAKWISAKARKAQRRTSGR